MLDLKARSFWKGQLPEAGTPLHPPRTIATDPEILKFEGGPPNASFPYWYDPSYWWDGVRTQFDLNRQLHIYKGALGLDRMARHDGESLFQLGERWLPLFAGIVALWFLGLRGRRLWSTLGVHKWLLVWPAITFLIFASVVIEIRYLIPFSMLAWTAIFAAAVTVTGLAQISACTADGGRFSPSERSSLVRESGGTLHTGKIRLRKTQ